MRVFISWSGELSHMVALAFHEWLPLVLQFVKPYVSSEDIEKGERWSTDIAHELEQSSYGIIIITPDNIDAPWVAFEAGALSKTLDKSRVSPFLFKLKRSELKGPLLQFQTTIFTKEDVRKLIKSINISAETDDRLDDSRLDHLFNVLWDELESKLKEIESQDLPIEIEKEPTRIESESILEEILELSRNQQRILSNPDQLFPPDYLRDVIKEFGEIPRSEKRKFLKNLGFLHRKQMDLLNEMNNIVHNVGDKDTRSFTEGELAQLQSLIDEFHNSLLQLEIIIYK